MADVFISYKSERRPAARHLADIIEAHGFSVWFDYGLVPGKNFGRHIEAELRQAKAVVVLWCPLSVGSEWVQNEAALAKRLGTFLPARIAPCEPALEFLRDDFVDITGWDGDPSTRQLDRLIDRLEALIGREAAIGRRRLVELHNAWSTYGRPTLPQFALGPRLDIPDSELAMPSVTRTASAPAPALPMDFAAGGWRTALQEAPRDREGVSGIIRRAGAGWMAGAAAGALLLAYSGAYYAGAPVPWPWSATTILPPVGNEQQQRIVVLEERIRREEVARAKAEAELKRQAELGAKAKSDLDARQKADADTATKRKADGEREAGAEAERQRLVALAAEEARRRAPKAGDVFRGCNDGCPEMVVVPAGSFTMGSNDIGWEKPPHPVTIRQPFAVGKFEVTFAEWAACVDDKGCAGNRSPGDEKWGKDRRPVINVSWNDAKEYVSWLSRKTGKTYRLLSEAEWEYAARAGTTTRYSWGDYLGKGNANCPECGSQWDDKQTAAVGSFKANPFGLFDTHGNVWEWVEDAWHPNYQGAPNDGSVWQGGETSSRVIRGGSWYYGVYHNNLQSAIRYWIPLASRASWLGFRIARTP